MYVSLALSGYHPQEILRGVGNILQLLEHVIHIFFLMGLNHGFRRELRVLFGLEKASSTKTPAGNGEVENGKLGLSQSHGGVPLELKVHRGQQNSLSPTPDVSKSSRHTFSEVL